MIKYINIYTFFIITIMGDMVDEAGEGADELTLLRRINKNTALIAGAGRILGEFPAINKN
jgi:hypothetical protein